MNARSTSLALLLSAASAVGIALGRLGAQAAPAPPALQERLEDSADEAPEGQYALGQQLYTEKCQGCHLPIPPAVFPAETWRELLSEPYHYGVRIELPDGPVRLLVWQYLRDYSRTLTVGERIPFAFGESRLFRALHPKVPLPRELNTRSCAACHPGAARGEFRRLGAQWRE